MIAGAPILFALDWQMGDKVDFSFSQFMFDETDVFLRYHISQKLAFSLHYLRSNYSNSEIFFKKESVFLDDQHVEFNNLTQYQTSVSLKLGIKTFDDIGFIITGGYNMGGRISLYDERSLAGETSGSDEFYVGLSLQYLKFR